ncbi:MAG: J domain-containing protein [Hyphomicrobiales bacterium]
MFNRGSGQSYGDRHEFSVRLKTDDGEEHFVKLFSASHHSVLGILNGADMFIEIEDAQGVVRIISKDTIKSIEPVFAPRTDQLKRRLKQTGSFDPYVILGVPQGADIEAIRAAYRDLATQYHPDRFASMDLPKEMSKYVDSMARRINMAWQELSKNADAA